MQNDFFNKTAPQPKPADGNVAQQGRGFRRILSVAMLGLTLGTLGSAGMLSPTPAALAADCSENSLNECVHKHKGVQIVFVLDTTGSMSNLIAGAKKKIWAIASEIVEIDADADVQMGLVGYRDRRDKYITKFFDLTADLDDIYGKLTAFRANGGGDTPESVNQALYEAVTQSRWSARDDILKMVFLVGDAPPHMDYKDDVKYPATLKIAREKGIIVSALQAGNMSKTTMIWKEIAQMGNGDYAKIPQSGNVVVIESPYDEDIRKIQNEIYGTVIPYGSRAGMEKSRIKLLKNLMAPAYVAADRSRFAMKRAPTRGKKVLTGKEKDLVDDLETGKVDLNTLKKKRLPRKLQGLSPEQLKQLATQKRQRRRKLEARLGKLVKQRSAYLSEKRKARRARKGGKDAFDLKILDGIRAKY